jgi:hypothetical protein
MCFYDSLHPSAYITPPGRQRGPLEKTGLSVMSIGTKGKWGKNEQALLKGTLGQIFLKQDSCHPHKGCDQLNI